MQIKETSAEFDNSCNKDNIGSMKTIIKTGGVSEEEFIEDDERIAYQYWIAL